ncbi:MAG: D-aminoacyl-tRNA deacylase [Planctomycetes bacterium]|nr:D-aminoacyl-tRNA deacylase [Planctomycetota bacterium]NUQ33997.1 D-tyrosyl-tRNA(Tyr) deacylase [Planctomycetaceae bacterium]
MRALLQRVSRAKVTVEGETVGETGHGLLIFLGVEVSDSDKELEALVAKIQGLRIFTDDQGKMNRSCEDVGGSYLAVSQFTLCADTKSGKRPGYERAMKPPESERMYERFCERLAVLTGRPVARGRFGAHMDVELVNDGPVTIWLDYPAG